MQALNIDPAVPFVVRPGSVAITLIGCGGTGSHIAQALARIAAHLNAQSRDVLRLTFVDGDTVEEKNVGRQLFSTGDVGQNKAVVLAQRFSALFGLPIEALPEMATASRLGDIHGKQYSNRYGIIVGAVDTPKARSVINFALEKQPGWHCWLDCGNHEHSGQVVCGTTPDRDKLHGAIKLGLCAQLPAPSLVYPELLTQAPRAVRADCAAAMEDNVQSLMINQSIASIAAQYLYQLIVQRRLTTFQTTLDLQTLSMRSTPITVRNLAAATGTPVGIIDGSTKLPKKETKAA